jgi:hypothetical protein
MKKEYVLRRLSWRSVFAIALLGSIPFTMLVAWNDAHATIPLDAEARWTGADTLMHYVHATGDGGVGAVVIAVLALIMCALYNVVARWLPLRFTFETKPDA